MNIQKLALAALLSAQPLRGSTPPDPRTWEVQCKAPISTPLTVKGNEAWFGGANTLYAVDTETGTILREEDLGKSGLPDRHYSGTTIPNFNIRTIRHHNLDTDPTIETLVATGDGRILIYDKDRKRSAQITDHLMGADVAGERIIATAFNGKVHGLDFHLEEQWSFDTTPGEKIYAPPATKDKIAVIANNRGLLFGLRNDGTLLWRERYNELYLAGDRHKNATPHIEGSYVSIHGLDEKKRTFHIATGALLSEEPGLPRRLLYLVDEMARDPPSLALYHQYDAEFTPRLQALRKQDDAIYQIGRSAHALLYGTWKGKVGTILLAQPDDQ